MRTALLFLMGVLVAGTGKLNAQKVDSIYFNLYVDSLKRGVYNYINVDGKLSNGGYIPLDSSHVKFSSNCCEWVSNSLYIDSAYTGDSVVIRAVLRAQPQISKTITIYIKKVNTEARLPTSEELLERWRREAKKKKD